MLHDISPYLRTEIIFKENNIYKSSLSNTSEGLKANAFYFNNPEWSQEYFKYCHRCENFRSRWSAASGSWNDKIVVDIGCGPGNVFATLGGKPKLLIGIDVAENSLKMASALGYTPLLADAHNLPLKAEFADIVAVNASLHHCDNMVAVLKEAARLVKPGGILVCDHDPQKSSWNYKGVAKLLWNVRLYLYALTKKGFHKSKDQQYWALASEIHHKPGHGVTKEMYMNALSPMGFSVKVYPHNHTCGAKVLKGEMGKADWKYRMANWFSGRNPDATESALSLMCVARREF